MDADAPPSRLEDDATASILGPDPDTEETRRERLAALLERRLDPIMAVLAVVWGVLVGYELVAPASHRDELSTISNVVWGIFVLEFVVKLVVSGRPLHFLRRRWPSLFFLAVPLLRTLRVVRALRTLRVLPATRVVGASYRTIGTARSLLGGRLSFLGVTTVAVIVAGAQLLFLLDPGAPSFGETTWWAVNLAVSGTYVFEPATVPSRLISLLLSIYAVIVFASLAATVGAYFIEQRAEQAASDQR